MTYWRMYCHLVWATKNRQPLIGEVEEEIIGASFLGTFTELGAVPHAIGFMPDHIHIAASIPPKHAVASLVQRLKGASTRVINVDWRRLEQPTFAWQDTYGVLSFSERNLPTVVDYVTDQKKRHAARTLWPSMERTSEPNDP